MIREQFMVKDIIPAEINEKLEAWGRWNRQPSGRGRGNVSVESRFRDNRCPLCYEKPDPCDVCKRVISMGEQPATPDVLNIERIVSRNVPRLSRDQLIAHYVYRCRPEATSRKLGIRKADYDMLLRRSVTMVANNLQKICTGALRMI